MTLTVDRHRLAELKAGEDELFARTHPRSRQLYGQARDQMLDGVPMSWMTRWASPFPLFVASAEGARVACVDGHEYIDLCLGDTGAMTGHSPAPAVAAIAEQAARGITTMLPTEDSLWVASELARRFGLQYWQMALTATDANRFAVRLARHVSGRPKILVYNYCYHGSVDETIITINDGVPGPKPGNAGPPVDPTVTTKVVEWNDTAAIAEALEPGDVACVLAEPAMTNIGIILPEDGYHAELRRLTRETGTLLILDETHTICAGPGGCTRAWGLEPDMVTLGKPIGSGVPSAAYGFGQAVADRVRATWDYHATDECGVGGTLAGNALSLAAMRATLGQVLTEAAFAWTVPLAERWAAGVQSVIGEYGLPWVVKRLGCRAEYWPRPMPPRNGVEAAAAEDEQLDRYLHLFMLNRGILMTPFHNMALMAPQTTAADVDCHTEVLREAVRTLSGAGASSAAARRT